MPAIFTNVILLSLITGGTMVIAAPQEHYAEIQVIDRRNGRGVPMVELETVNGLVFITDNAGRIAFHEPGLMDREVYFSVRSHGYTVPKDGFGFAGVRLTPSSGKRIEIAIDRQNIAERLCRLTGEGLYRDSVLLGHSISLPDPLNPGRVGGQDSVLATPYRGKVMWLWGDTHRMNYPLGLFRTAGALTPLFPPNDPKSDPAHGIPYQYFVDDQSGFTRAMMPLPERPEGVVWLAALTNVPTTDGKESLIAHYSRRKSLGEEYEQGIAGFDDAQKIFKPLTTLPLDEKWRKPTGHPIHFEDQGKKWLLFGSPSPNVRVPANRQAVLDPKQYEALTCCRIIDGKPTTDPELTADGKPVWRWQKELPPVDSKTERAWIKAGKLKPEHARFCPMDVKNPTDRIELHSGTVRWNAHRKCWILLAGQLGGSSLLGEVWYAESDQPTGPFRKAMKVVTHDRQTFYNVCHHEFLDRDNGRIIHFEGTYTNDFSGNPLKTPRYNYNQMLYRLNLDDLSLHPARHDSSQRESIRPSADPR